MKSYNLSFEEVTKKISYPNLILLSAVIPSYETDKKRSASKEEIAADDPRNNERILRMFGQ